MKNTLVVLTAAVIMCSPALCTSLRAQDAQPKKERAMHEKPALTDMTVTGKVTKEESTRPAPAGQEAKPMVHYVLTDKDGNKIGLGGRHEDKEPAQGSIQVNWADYVDKDVTVVGKGFTREHEGKKWTNLVVITKVDVVAPVAAAAPVAPAATK